jgi:ketosteroid isomerase-like protein
MTRIIRISVLMALVAILCLSNLTLAQEWSKEQKEVWKSVQAYWDLAAKGDAAGFLSYFHDSFVGWAYGTDVPQSKEDRKKMIEYSMQKNETLLYTVTPVSIWVKGNFAFVNYFYNELEKDSEGKEKWSSGRWTDILTKQGDKWLMIGDHGGQTSKDN